MSNDKQAAQAFKTLEHIKRAGCCTQWSKKDSRRMGRDKFQPKKGGFGKTIALHSGASEKRTTGCSRPGPSGWGEVLVVRFFDANN